MKKTKTKILAVIFTLLSITATTTATARTLSTPEYGPHIHRLAYFSEKDVLRMHDGSEWMAATPNEAYVAYSWQQGDRIIISPNNGFFTSPYYYPFYLTNLDKDSYIRVSPVASPVLYGEFAYWIQNVNLRLGYLTLAVGQGGIMTWEISDYYYNTIENWEPNDHIVIGVYDSYFPSFCSYPYTLINFNKANFVQARPH